MSPGKCQAELLKAFRRKISVELLSVSPERLAQRKLHHAGNQQQQIEEFFEASNQKLNFSNLQFKMKLFCRQNKQEGNKMSTELYLPELQNVLPQANFFIPNLFLLRRLNCSKRFFWRSDFQFACGWRGILELVLCKRKNDFYCREAEFRALKGLKGRRISITKLVLRFHFSVELAWRNENQKV